MIEKLKKIDFHDTDVEYLKMNFNKSRIELKIAEYDDLEQRYIYKKIKFLNVKGVRFENFKFNTLRFESIYSFTLNEDDLSVSFIFLQGTSLPSSRLDFNFESIIFS